MTIICSLWLPILVSSVAVFLVSSIIHMFLPWHKNDYLPLPSEEKILEALRSFSISPGDYMFPRPSSMKEMKSTEFKEKQEKGPVGVITLWKHTSMSGSMVLWFLFSVVINIFAAYIAGHALVGKPSNHGIFRYVGTAAFMGYTFGVWPMSIWYHRKWSTTIKTTIDGFIFAVVTAFVFIWLWP
ncbi:MAG TPA: hypothetical protein VMU30_03260 [Bacteroidota bacterium]|nr:hypothetical protein [Bacteroidota bacterium]